MAQETSFLKFPPHRISELRKEREEKRVAFLRSRTKTREEAKALIPSPVAFFLKNPRSATGFLLAGMTFFKMVRKNASIPIESKKKPSLGALVKTSFSETALKYGMPLFLKWGVKAARLLLRG